MRAGAALGLLLVVASAAAAQTAPDVSIHITADGVELDGPVVEVEAEHGSSYVFELDLDDAYQVGELVIDPFVNVSRPKQMVVELDGRYFTEVHTFDVADADTPARILNVTEGADGTVRYRLGLPGPGRALLSLVRDVEAPSYEIDPPTNVTHRSFLLVTRTSEFAFAEVQVRAQASRDWVRHPTTVPALEQTFPVQGLRPDTDYVYRVRFWDWSDNAVTAPERALRTSSAPDVPVPHVFFVFPDANSTVPADAVTVRVMWESPGSPVAPHGVRLFFDKREVHDGFSVVAGTLAYRPPGPLDERSYSVSAEITNEAGGKAVARWSFDVERGSDVPGLGALWALLALASAAARRRET